MPSGIFPLRARTSCSACLGSLRPSERRSVSQAWSRCRSGGMQGWSDWSGAGAKLASQACAGRTGLTLGAKRVPMPCSGRMSSKCQLCEGACRTGHRAKRPSKPAAPAALRTIVRVAAIFPLPDTRARQEPLEGRDGLDCNERVRKDKASDARACVAKGPPCLALANPRRRPGARPARAEA